MSGLFSAHLFFPMALLAEAPLLLTETPDSKLRTNQNKFVRNQKAFRLMICSARPPENNTKYNETYDFHRVDSLVNFATWKISRRIDPAKNVFSRSQMHSVPLSFATISTHWNMSENHTSPHSRSIKTAKINSFTQYTKLNLKTAKKKREVVFFFICYFFFSFFFFAQQQYNNQHAALTLHPSGGAAVGMAHAHNAPLPHSNLVSAHAHFPYLVSENAGLFVNSALAYRLSAPQCWLQDWDPLLSQDGLAKLGLTPKERFKSLHNLADIYK